MLRYLKLIIISFSCIISSCRFSLPEKQLHISFTADRSAIMLSGIDEVGMMQLKHYLDEGQETEALISVVQLIAEDDSAGMEQACPGILALKKGQLLFIPEQPFVKGKSYQVQTLIDSRFGATADILSGNVGSRIKQQSVVLVR
ncbi:hypothetical protein D9M68_525180 [compost metagenome]